MCMFKTVKIYAKQVPPEYQESPLFSDECFPDNIAIIGGGQFNKHAPKVFSTVLNVLESGMLGETLENIKSLGIYKNATQLITEYLPPFNGKYSTNAIHALKSLISQYATCSRSAEDEILCKVLSIVTGKTWGCDVIRGSSQSQCEKVYYPVDEWNKEAISIFEKEYFNTGTEWVIHDEETTPEDASDVNGSSIYCTAWDVEGVKKEIAKAIGVTPKDVVLYKFDGNRQVALYKQI